METVKSAHRALLILELLTAMEAEVTFTEIADRLDLPRSSVSGLLRTMTDAGWLRLDPHTRAYSLGIRALEAGNAYQRSLGLPARALPIMTDVRDELNEIVQLAVLDGRFNVYIAKVDGSHALRLASEVGRRLPAHATGLGKAILAYLDHSDLLRRFEGVVFESYTPNTITSMEALEDELHRIRRQGFAIDNEEYSLGVRCVAAPVRDHSGTVSCAISVSAPMFRFDRARRARARDLIVRAAADLSRTLGYDPH